MSSTSAPCLNWSEFKNGTYGLLRSLVPRLPRSQTLSRQAPYPLQRCRRRNHAGCDRCDRQAHRQACHPAVRDRRRMGAALYTGRRISLRRDGHAPGNWKALIEIEPCFGQQQTAILSTLSTPPVHHLPYRGKLLPDKGRWPVMSEPEIPQESSPVSDSWQQMVQGVLAVVLLAGAV